MIPRLPPLLLIAIGGATVYGIQNVLNRLEQRVLESPDAKSRIPFKIQHAAALRVARAGIIGATIAYTGYWSKINDAGILVQMFCLLLTLLTRSIRQTDVQANPRVADTRRAEGVPRRPVC